MTNSERIALIKKNLREIEGAAQDIKGLANGDKHLTEISEALHLDTLAILDNVERLKVAED
ncbi:MAG: hypothetical protein K6G27_05360 [Lachnospiraceae bacterium]|nr:hypothetical protein [Lachnospiraceae bacterium]